MTAIFMTGTDAQWLCIISALARILGEENLIIRNVGLPPTLPTSYPHLPAYL